MHRLVDIKEKGGDRWSSFTAEVQQFLKAAITADGTTKGNVQLFNPYVDGLQIVAHHGFDKPFLQQPLTALQRQHVLTYGYGKV